MTPHDEVKQVALAREQMIEEARRWAKIIEELRKAGVKI
jgi:hypothetical protein